jgi:hypothetical protein
MIKKNNKNCNNCNNCKKNSNLYLKYSSVYKFDCNSIYSSVYKHVYKEYPINTIIKKFNNEIHSFFIDFLNEFIENNQDKLLISLSHSLLTNVYEIIFLYIKKNNLINNSVVKLDKNLIKIIDMCINVSNNRIGSGEKNLFFIENPNNIEYLCLNKLIIIPFYCVIKNNDFYYLKKKYLTYICIKKNIPSFVIRHILEYYLFSPIQN